MKRITGLSITRRSGEGFLNILCRRGVLSNSLKVLVNSLKVLANSSKELCGGNIFDRHAISPWSATSEAFSAFFWPHSGNLCNNYTMRAPQEINGGSTIQGEDLLKRVINHSTAVVMSREMALAGIGC